MKMRRCNTREPTLLSAMVEKGGIGCGNGILVRVLSRSRGYFRLDGSGIGNSVITEFWRASGPNLVVELMPTEVLLANEGRA